MVGMFGLITREEFERRWNDLDKRLKSMDDSSRHDYNVVIDRMDDLKKDIHDEFSKLRKRQDKDSGLNWKAIAAISGGVATVLGFLYAEHVSVRELVVRLCIQLPEVTC